MITNSSSAIIRQTAIGAFIKSLGEGQATVDYSPFISVFKTATKQADFGWFGAIDYPAEWGGGRAGSDMKAYTDTLTPKVYGRTYDIDADLFADDQTGTAAERAKGVAYMCREYTNVLASEFFEAGTAGTIDTAYDGQFFYDTDHDESGTNQDNDLTGTAATGTDPTSDEFETGVGDALEAAAAFKDDKGHPIGGRAGAVIEVPPRLIKVASIVLGSRMAKSPVAAGEGGAADQSGVTGVFRNQYSWFVNYHATNTDRFKIHWPASAQSVGPLVMNMREDWRIKTYDPTNDKDCDNRNLIQIATRARFVVGPGLWQKSIVYIFT